MTDFTAYFNYDDQDQGDYSPSSNVPLSATARIPLSDGSDIDDYERAFGDVEVLSQSFYLR